MSLHKLTAGSGYEYLTRQVAVQDVTERGAGSLASYYAEKGESPGRWVGSGVEGIEGLAVGSEVTGLHMRALFGYGHHPLADQRKALLPAQASPSDLAAATSLGRPFNVFDKDTPRLVVEVTRRVEQFNVDAGVPRDAPVDFDLRARVRSEVAAEFFEQEMGRPPGGSRELAAAVARYSRPRTTAVAGYDLSFSPVKSVSTLWAVAGEDVAAKIEEAHAGAVRDALTFIEKHALFTRTGPQGVKQVDVRGLVAAAFTHRDSRAGDPDLHTHVAVANKVETRDGKWLAIDGRILFKANVAASETYNTALEHRLVESLGVRFAQRPGTDPRKRPVREIVGVEPVLNARWSSRRARIDVRRAELATTFQRDHGRPPTPVEAIHLAQRATLETRDAKHAPRSPAEQRAAWRVEAVDVLGSLAAVDRMVRACTGRDRAPGDRVTAGWVSTTATSVLETIQGHRATWQVWHVRAEAQRMVRGADVRAGDIDRVVSLVVDSALDLSVRLTTDRDDVVEPAGLRRVDGSSVFHVAGSDVFTSRAVLAAERRIVTSAGLQDGRAVREADVQMALLGCAANGTDLNAGQVALVRGMALSGARVQLGIAAAGTGKTTAMNALTRAWEESGGTVLGVAPSAAAAAALGGQTGATTDTLAKLVHSLDNAGASELAAAIGPLTLVLVDEAGMADTPSLDRAIDFALGRGASVRLIGDDQQLSAIGAGGVLRDVENQHGAVRLIEPVRFADPAEAAASLALRDGLPESLGYYLDNGRIHAGDLTTETDEVFSAWSADRGAGLDSVMLAPTRDLVAELNARARTARMAGGTLSGRPVRLADGNEASVGDVVITRQNDRRLRVSSTDWVKNGDRWTVTAARGGSLTVRHSASNTQTVLPARYVAEHTELGYASTTHTAQGLSVDTMHGLATGEESRQQLYTMMSRGRHANHLYLVSAGDGDPHDLVRPETVHPRTATDVFERVLARDGAPRSATTVARDAVDPGTRLGQASARYLAALRDAVECTVGASRTEAVEQAVDALVPGIADEPAWPTLRARLLMVEAAGRDAAAELTQVMVGRGLDGVQDRAAVLDWRLETAGSPSGRRGPLPWLPAVPSSVASSSWGPYLRSRGELVAGLVPAVRDQAVRSATPRWASQGGARPMDDVLADVAVWRASNGVAGPDPRPTGPPQAQEALAVHQRELDERVNAHRAPALAEWGPAIDDALPRRDSFTPLLAERLAAISRAGVDAASLLRAAAEEGPVPDDHGAAALWWRINRHLSPAVATQDSASQESHASDWTGRLVDQLGEHRTAELLTSSWWPTAVAAMEDAGRRGWTVPALLDLVTTGAEDVDPAQALVWRIALMTDPPPEDDPHDLDPPPHDLDAALPTVPTPAGATTAPEAAADLATAAWERDLLGPLELTDRDVAQVLDDAYQWDHSPVPGDRVLQVNDLATRFFEHSLDGSWAQAHLQRRLGHDVTGDVRFRPGYAPAGWTRLVDHLRRAGTSDDEMLAAGVATRASTGRLIDRFRDRAVLPVISDDRVLGFVGRRHPDACDGTLAGPKYLNTADTVAFRKGAQLYGLPDEQTTHGAVPVVVEGPVDAIAVTVASGGAFVGVAPLGTSLTRQQARQLAGLRVDPVVATDGDLAGRLAAERGYWLLTPHLLVPRFVPLAAWDDPASLLERDGPARLVLALQTSRPLADTLLSERVAHLPATQDRDTELGRVIAALPPASWGEAVRSTTRSTGTDPASLVRAVTAAAKEFTADRGRFSDARLAHVGVVRARLEQAATASPADRWAALARSLDPRLVTQRDWPATASVLQQVQDSGQDAPALARHVVAGSPLQDAPAQDLRHRLAGHLPHGAVAHLTGASKDPTLTSEQAGRPDRPVERPPGGQQR